MSSNKEPTPRLRWLNRTVLGIGLASLFSDFSHEVATALLPTFLATMGVAAAWLGIIEGVSDGLSSVAKMGSGFYTDKLQRRKPIAVLGYIVTALGTASFGLATTAWHVLLARASAWLGRGVRTPVKKALLASAVTKETYGRAFGFERMMDTIGAIIGPISAVFLLAAFHHRYPPLFALTLIPGLGAAALIAFLVQEKERKPVSHVSFGERLRSLPKPYQKFLVAVGLVRLRRFRAQHVDSSRDAKTRARFRHRQSRELCDWLFTWCTMFSTPPPRPSPAGWRIALKNHSCFPPVTRSRPSWPCSSSCCRRRMWTFVLIFVLGGIYIGVEETLEDSLCAELVSEEHHGMAFGVLATVNGIGDFLSSIVVGLLWTYFGTTVAFGYSAVLFVLGALLVARTKTQ